MIVGYNSLRNWIMNRIKNSSNFWFNSGDTQFYLKLKGLVNFFIKIVSGLITKNIEKDVLFKTELLTAKV